MSDETRLQLDIRQMPEGVVPRLRAMAKERGMTLATYLKDALTKHVAPSDPGPPHRVSPPAYTITTDGIVWKPSATAEDPPWGRK